MNKGEPLHNMKHATIFKGGARAAIVLLALTILLLMP